MKTGVRTNRCLFDACYRSRRAHELQSCNSLPLYKTLPTSQTSPVDSLGICSHGTGSADLEAMFCPQDDPYTCIGTYVIKQQDMDAGGYSTTSRATSVSPNRTIIVDAEDSTVELLGAAGISVGEKVS